MLISQQETCQAVHSALPVTKRPHPEKLGLYPSFSIISAGSTTRAASRSYPFLARKRSTAETQFVCCHQQRDDCERYLQHSLPRAESNSRLHRREGSEAEQGLSSIALVPYTLNSSSHIVHALMQTCNKVFRNPLWSIHRLASSMSALRCFSRLGSRRNLISGERPFWALSNGDIAALNCQISTPSEMARASSSPTPRYRTVLSILVWPSKSWTALKFPVFL